MQNKLLKFQQFTHKNFVPIGGRVISVTLTVNQAELPFSDPSNKHIAEIFTGTRTIDPNITIQVGGVSEEDLLAAQKAEPENADIGNLIEYLRSAKEADSQMYFSAANEIESLLKFMRAAKDAEAQAAAKPVRVEITNASEFADKRGTVLRVERDGTGQLTGAVAQKI